MAIPILFSYVFAAGTETWYTDFEITSQEALSTSSGQTTWSYTWSLTNHDTDAIEWEFYFVDAVPLVNGYYACKADNQSGVFGQYLHMDGSTNFYVQSWKTITWTINFDFPASYSGTYHGCIVYSVRNDLNTWGDVVMNMTSRKAKKVSVTLQASEVGIHIVANLGSRGNSQTSNNNWYESRWKILFYDPSQHTVVKSWYITMDHEWYWELVWETILAGTYDVVYKSRQHLASYLPNVTINNEWDLLNFVIGDNLTWIGFWEQTEQFKYNSWWAYQVAWDLPNGSGIYDFQINTVDLSVLRSDRLCPEYNGGLVQKPNICDLNNDWRVNSNDDTVILEYLPNYDDTIYYFSHLFPEDSFGEVDYRERKGVTD